MSRTASFATTDAWLAKGLFEMLVNVVSRHKVNISDGALLDSFGQRD